MFLPLAADDLHFDLLVRLRRAPAAEQMRPSLHDERILDRESLLAFVLYATLSVLLLGRALIFDYSGSYEGRGSDPAFFIWAIHWWPYAISHRLNPFLTNVIFAPGGV